MKQLISAIFVFSVSLPLHAQEVYPININRVCAAIVGIPYASDNFSDEEWEEFKKCVSFMRTYKEH